MNIYARKVIVGTPEAVRARIVLLIDARADDITASLPGVAHEAIPRFTRAPSLGRGVGTSMMPTPRAVSGTPLFL